MLKLVIPFLAILGVTYAAALSTSEVSNSFVKDFSNDWADFSALIPWNEVQDVTAAYFAEDQEIQALAMYLDSDEFKNTILAVEAIPEYITFVDFLNGAGLDFYGVINTIRRFLDFEELPVPSSFLSSHNLKSTRITGGVSGLFADIKAILPLDDLRALHIHKLGTSEEFASLIADISSNEFRVIANELKGNEEWQKHRAEVVAGGLDVDALFALLRLLFGLDSTYST